MQTPGKLGKLFGLEAITAVKNVYLKFFHALIVCGSDTYCPKLCVHEGILEEVDHNLAQAVLVTVQSLRQFGVWEQA